MFVKGYRNIFREAKLKTHYVEWGEGLGHMRAKLYCPAISPQKAHSSERPSQVDLDALCRTQAPAVPAELVSGHDYRRQRLGEEVVSLADRQQNPGDRTADLTEEENKME